MPAQLIDVSDFIFDIHKQLVPLHEEWVGGIKLAPTNIYGIRVNRNGSALALHYDKVSFSAARMFYIFLFVLATRLVCCCHSRKKVSLVVLCFL